MPGSGVLCRERHAGQGADTPAMVTSRRHLVHEDGYRFLTGRWPRGTGLTSYLSGCFYFCSWVTWFFTPPQSGTFTSFARPAHSPRCRFLCAPGLAKEPGLLAGWTRRETPSRAGTTVAAKTLWGDGISTGIETVPGPDSVCARFLDSRLTAQLLIRVCDWCGHDPDQRSW
jgi:hypothetical protein